MEHSPHHHPTLETSPEKAFGQRKFGQGTFGIKVQGGHFKLTDSIFDHLENHVADIFGPGQGGIQAGKPTKKEIVTVGKDGTVTRTIVQEMTIGMNVPFGKMGKFNPEEFFGNFYKPKIADHKDFDNVPVKADLEDIMKSTIILDSNKIKVDNKQADIAKRKQEIHQEEQKPYEDESHDLKGEDRPWNNWVVPTFNPTRASVIGTGSAVKPPQPSSPTKPAEPSKPASTVPAVAESLQLSPGLPPYVSGQETTIKSKEYEQAKAECDKEKKPFRDPRFPAEPKSIIGHRPDLYNDPKRSDNIRKADWLRPAVLFQGKPFYVYEKSNIEPDDLKQGELGDCYFLAAVACLAQVPDRLKRILRVRRTNEAGVYCVSLCVGGVWEDVIIDDRIPSMNQKGFVPQPVFSSNRGTDIWVPLIEKAWAKIHGGYLNVEKGSMEESLHAMTGAPTTEYIMDNEKDTPETIEEHWDLLLRGRNNGYILGAGTVNGKSGRTRTSKGIDTTTGLVLGHAYSILGVYEIAMEGGKPRRLGLKDKTNPANLRLIKIRNPWGRSDWTQPSTVKFTQWSPELKQLVHYEEKGDDGVWFITFKNFHSEFASFVVSKFRDDYKYSGVKLETSSKDPTTLQFTISKQGKYCFSLNQMSKRYYPDSEQYVYSAVSLFIAKIGPAGEIQEYGCNHQQNITTHVETELSPGTYVAHFYTPWRRKVNEIGFSIYGPEQINNVLVLGKGVVPEDFIMKFFISKARKVPSSVMKPLQGQKNIVTFSENTTTGLGYMMIDNKSPDALVTATVRLGDAVGTVFYPPTRGEVAVLSIPPGRARIIAFRMTEPRSQFSFEQQTSLLSGYPNHVASVKRSGKVLKRPTQDGKEVGVCIYMLKGSNFMMYYYENASKDFELKEYTEFEMRNCRMDCGQDSLYIELKPGRSRLVTFFSKGGSDFDVKVKQSQFSVVPNLNLFVNSVNPQASVAMT